jgi:hypothetical protein
MAVIGFGTRWQLSNETTPVFDAQEGSLDVRSWPKADAQTPPINVCLLGKGGHRKLKWSCPVRAN